MASPCTLELNPQVIFEESSCVRKVILNRSHKLNCLTYEMISQISRTLEAIEYDSAVKLIILKGRGKAFCAGGDVLGIIRSITAGHWTFAASFYRKQQTLDYLIATYKKPLISLINGIIMGGGAGISLQGNIQVVTETTVFAMPEASIGLFSDVGTSYFLAKLPGSFGEYLALTGARINGAEMLACGLATHFVLSEDLPLLENALCTQVSLDMPTILEIINRFAKKAELKQNSIFKRLEIINKCFSQKTVEEILSSLKKEAVNGVDKWITEAISSMNYASPTSLKISLRTIREARMQDLEQCLIRDYTISCNLILRSPGNDVFEGSRALLFDKDKEPKWDPSKLELVSDEIVNQYFTRVQHPDWKYLQLPLRFSPIIKAKAKI